MTHSQVAGELESLLQAYDAQLAAGRTLLQATQRVAETLAVIETGEAVGDEAALVDRLVQTQNRAFEEFQATATASERAGQVVRRRFGLQAWDWDQIRSEVLLANGSGAADGSARDAATDLIFRLNERQQALAELMQEVMKLQTSIEGNVRHHLQRLSDRFRIIRQGTMAARAYDAGMKGYSRASAMFIDRTR